LNFLVVGASGGLGRAICERLAEAGHHLIVVSSDVRDLEAMRSDLDSRHGTRVCIAPADTATDGGYLDEVVRAAQEMGGVDGVLFPIGGLSPDDSGALDAASVEWLVRTNFTVIVDAVSRLLPPMRELGRGAIVGFGTIAAERGRGRNVVYASAKRALQTYFESLRHLCSGSGVVVQFYVLGYLDTSLASGRTKLFPKGSPERLADRVLANLNRDMPIVYYPWFWRFVGLGLRWTPWFLFKRLRF